MNGNGESTEIKITWEERLVRAVWSWKQQIFPHPHKQRYSPDDKALLAKTIRVLVRLAITLTIGAFALGYIVHTTINITVLASNTKTDAVQSLTAWAYPKADKRMSRTQVEETVRAHLENSDRPEHTLAICMAESRLFAGATNPKLEDVTGGGQVRTTVWGTRSKSKALVKAGIIKDDRDLFDPVVTARAVSFILNRYLSLLPDDLRTPGIRITYALTMYNGHAQGKAVMKDLADRNTKLTNKELNSLLSKLDYPVEVLAYTGEILAVRQGVK